MRRVTCRDCERLLRRTERIGMKKKIAYLLTSAMVAGCLVGCGGAGTKEQTTGTPTAEPTKAVTTPAAILYKDQVEVPAVIDQYKVAPSEPMGVSVTAEMLAASIINQGNITRIADVMVRAAKGEEITIAYIGGSITNGSSASPQQTSCYAYLTTEWWKKAFPDAKINYVNAGIGATDSYLGVHRVQKDVLDYEPDLVVVEFSVNDGRAHNKETYESLLRKILGSKTAPAVVSLFLTQENGSDYQMHHQQVAFKLEVPMVSYRNTVLPAMQAGTLQWSSIGAPDGTHPNNGGHSVIAYILTNFFRSVQDQITTMEYKPYTLTDEKLTLSRYEDGTMYDNTNLTATSLDGFEIKNIPAAQFPNGWQTTTGGTATFTVTGKNIGMVYYGTLDGKSGQFDVYIDGEFCQKIDANFVGQWGSYADYRELKRFDEEGEHVITIQPAEGSTGDQFTVLAFTVSK